MKMKRFKNLLIAAAVLSGLAIIGTIMNSHQAEAQGPPGGLAVNIVNPLPVPVTGSTTVSGTIAATQSGAWNVGITGTPNVQIANPATAPALTLDISRSASQHVILNCIPLQLNGCADQSGSSPYMVPAGQNLVVTSVDIIGSAQNASFQIAKAINPHFVFETGDWSVPFDNLTHSFPYPGGIVFPAGFTFDSTTILQSGTLTILRGFLTAN
jgi:hypothetical protein